MTPAVYGIGLRWLVIPLGRDTHSQRPCKPKGGQLSSEVEGCSEGQGVCCERVLGMDLLDQNPKALSMAERKASPFVFSLNAEALHHRFPVTIFLAGEGDLPE